jgi:hypothetical protein
LRSPITLNTGVRILGYYLLAVGLIQLGILAWSHSADTLWSWTGLVMLSDLIGGAIGIDHADLKVYCLSLLWFSGLAVLMVLGQRPLKTYVVSEAVLLLTSTVLGYGLESFSELIRLSLLIAFDALPLIWAARLLWLEYKAWLGKPRSIPICRTKKLGQYLLFGSIYQFLYLVVFLFRFPLLNGNGLLGAVDFSRFKTQGQLTYVKGPGDDLAIHLLVALDPRLGLDVFNGVLDAIHEGDGTLFEPEPMSPFGVFDPDDRRRLEMAPISPGLLGISFLLVLAFAIFLRRGRQPLRTYLMSETLFAGPNVLLLLAAPFIPNFPWWWLPLWQWYVVTIVFTLVWAFVSVLPCIWALSLLWSGRHSPPAGVEAS